MMRLALTLRISESWWIWKIFILFRLGTSEDIIYKDIEKEVDRSLLRKALETLSEREQTIIRLRFGIDDKLGQELTQKEVADLLGISQSYISRLEKKIMKRLKKEILRLEGR